MAIGAAAVVLGLGRPFYVLHLRVGGAERLDAAGGAGDGMGALVSLVVGPAIRRAESPGGLPVDGWTAFAQLDLALLAGALVALALVAAAAVGRLSAAALRVVWMLGAAGTAAVAYRALIPPGPRGVLDPGMGAWIVLAGCAAVALGGWLVSAAD